MPRKVVTVVSPPSNEKLCCFCGLGNVNELQYGKFHEYNGIRTHYYCLLLSSNMQQKGRDDEGILGFLPEDINKELKRGKRLACCYCKKTGATLGCCNTKCKKIFHFPCGLKAGSLHQFFGEFRSYCKNHRPKQKIDDRVSEEVKKRDDMICYICYDDVSPIDIYGTLWAPCCKKNAWFHRTCVQQLAMSAGYFFKCPLCNNKDDFQRAMLDHGIFIPSQDASWELVPNAFEELLYRHNRCDALECLCPKGREHTSTNAKWELTLCRTCGSQGIHMACGNLKWVKPIWECTECTSILNKTLTSDSESSSVPQANRLRRSLQECENSMNDDSSDSDISVGTESIEASTSNCHNSEDQEDEPPDSPPALRITRRSVIPITKSPVTTKSPTTTTTKATVTMHEHLPPEPKKPRYTDHRNERNRRESIDSDDDIVVISGPSRDEKSASNKCKSPIQRLDDKSWSGKKRDKIEKSFEELADPTNTEKTPYVALDKFEMPQVNPSLRAPKESETKVVEIDLSEAEYTIPKIEPNPVPDDTSAVNPCADPPELNFMITNVTSLAPEAFENVEEQKPESKQDSTNVPSHTSIFNKSNGGLTAQTPIVIDDEPLPVAPNYHATDNNNLHFSSPVIHDQIKIIRFDSPLDAEGKPMNTVLYGITIPGTNQTVPLIFAPTGNTTNTNPTSETGGNLNPGYVNQPGNNGLNFPQLNFVASFNGLKPPENHKISSTTPIRSVEAQNPSKSEPSSLSTEVPLKSVVNERFSVSRSHRKSNDKSSNKTVVISNQSSLDQAFGSKFTTKNVGVQVQPVTSKNSAPAVQTILPQKPVLQPKPITTVSPGVQVKPVQNGAFMKFGGPPIFPKASPAMTPISQFSSTTSTTLKTSVTNAQNNNKMPNNVDATTISKMFALFPSDPSSVAKTNSPLANGLDASTTSRTSLNSVKLNPPTTGTVNAFIPGVNTTWLHSSGSVIKINSETAKIGVAPSHVNLVNQVETQKSTENEQQNISRPQLFQLIRTDSDPYSNAGCDGDAGSAPADQPASVDPSSIPRPVTARDSELDEPLQVGTDNTYDRRTSIAECDSDTIDAAERSASPDRSDACNRTGLIYKSINLRDLKFSVCGSNIIKMALYDTYTVNIKLDSLNPCKKSKYSCRRTIKSSANRQARTRNIEREDATDVSNSLDSQSSVFCSNNDRLNQIESTSQDNESSVESNNRITDLPSIDVQSRGQEELKENLDPVPLSTNSCQNSPSAVDRKSKFRVRSGVDHSMRSLNEKEGQQMMSEKQETPKKIITHDSQSLENHSKVLYNGWNDSACHEETNVQNVLIDRSVEMTTKNVAPCNFAEDSDMIYSSKRRRTAENDENLGVMQNFVKISSIKEPNDCNNGNFKHLVNDARILRKIHVNSTINKRKEESLSCKVSIDLARIRSFLDIKLNRSDKIVDERQRNVESSAENFDNHEFSVTESGATLFKFRSFDNLSSDPVDDNSVELLRKTKSLEDLCSLFSRSPDDDIVENGIRGYKRKRRSFEEHDCVR